VSRSRKLSLTQAFTDVQYASVFIVIDSVTTVIQIVGAALIGVASSKDSRGEETKITSAQANNILLAGLALQVSALFDSYMLELVPSRNPLIKSAFSSAHPSLSSWRF
jgi:hypothetical protein